MLKYKYLFNECSKRDERAGFFFNKSYAVGNKGETFFLLIVRLIQPLFFAAQHGLKVKRMKKA